MFVNHWWGPPGVDKAPRCGRGCSMPSAKTVPASDYPTGSSGTTRKTFTTRPINQATESPTLPGRRHRTVAARHHSGMPVIVGLVCLVMAAGVGLLSTPVTASATPVPGAASAVAAGTVVTHPFDVVVANMYDTSSEFPVGQPAMPVAQSVIDSLLSDAADWWSTNTGLDFRFTQPSATVAINSTCSTASLRRRQRRLVRRVHPRRP